jgi:hypothetical protein
MIDITNVTWSGLPVQSAMVGFLPFMRAGEFTSRSAKDFDSSSSLTPHDISVDQHANSSIVCIHMKQSKTDPFGHGVDIYIGRTGIY